MSHTGLSPLAAPAPWDIVAPHYAEEIVPVFETYAREALARAGVGPGMRVLDVAAGPGTLSVLAARQGARVDALDFSPGMVAQLESRVSRERLSDLRVTHGDGMALPFEDGRFDAAFSMFGLMFFPDRGRGFSELHRVLRPGAHAVVASWSPLDRVPAFGTAFGALSEALASPGRPPTPAPPMPLSDPEVCCAEMRAAGFEPVAVSSVVEVARYASVEHFLDSMIRAHAPVAVARAGLGERWPEIEGRFRDRVKEQLGEGPVEAEMTALLAHGRR